MPDTPPVDHPDAGLQVRGTARKYREGHPRFNLVVLLALVLALLVFAMIEAQRLAF